MIPGSNLLDMAFNLIAQQILSYFKASGRTVNAVGQNVTNYDNPIFIEGSFQPVSKNLYQALGLDFQKSYFNLYVSKNIIDIRRDVTSDQVVFNGRLFQCLSNTEWIGIDGWAAVLCVEVGGVPPNNKPIFGFNAIPSVN